MARKLKKIKVEAISLVKAGANGKVVLLKAADAKPPVFDKAIVMKSVDGVLYGIVYSPDEIDKQGDFTDAAEIKKAAYDFMKSLSGLQVDMGHDGKKREAYVAESWLLRKNDPLFPAEKEGSWAVGIKLEDAGLISAVEKGEIAGLSMAGTAEAEDIEKDVTGVLKTVSDFFKGLMTEKKEPKQDEPVKAVETVKPEEILKAIETGVTPMAKLIESLSKQAKELEVTVTGLVQKSGQNVSLGKQSDVSGIV